MIPDVTHEEWKAEIKRIANGEQTWSDLPIIDFGQAAQPKRRPMFNVSELLVAICGGLIGGMIALIAFL